MDPEMLRNSFPHHSQISQSAGWSPKASSSRGYYKEGPSPTTSPVKQTWEEFCREQEKLHGGNMFTGRVISQNNINNVPTSHKPPSNLSSDSYRNSPQTNSVRHVNNNGNNRWQPRTNFKRSQTQESDHEPLLKISKKRKKPLSQAVPAKREWSLEDAERALSIEKECNKRCKSALIIKFPDLELNRDIVAGFHPDIENVHFQQPSTPRFCFVTLKESANIEAVLASLNKQKFGHSYLLAEHKKDRDDDQAVSAKDVDPFTLYVGNLAQEITKDDMTQLYPNSRRIDIGYAKKMKYTRYAFVVFHTIDEAIDSFKRTHNHQVYNKSLIVRFRRLHGTVGMPGDGKQQNPPKQTHPETVTSSISNDDLVEVTYANNTVTPFTINLKQEYPPRNEYDDDNEGFDEYSEANLTHHPKYIKIEVKKEIKPEVYEYAFDTKIGIKSEFKKENNIDEIEFDEIYDVELEHDPHYSREEFDELCIAAINQRKQVDELRSSAL